MTGRFVWHELMTSDVASAIAFYAEVAGWKTEPFPGGTTGQEPYTMWVGSQGSLGGVMTLRDDAKARGVPPHWMGSVEVDDIDATIAKVQAGGGTVLVPPMTIPDVGRISVVADPQGASLSVFQPNGPMQSHDTSKAGEISWNELYARDAPAAFSYYSELFGWQKLDEMDMGTAGKYLIFGQDGKHYGGMMTKTPDMQMPPSWVYYIQVDDIEAAMARATSRGAKSLFGPTEVPGGTWVAQLIDPQGALFALHGPRSAK